MILHIFKKDARRLWMAIAVSLLVLGALAWHDRNRSDRMVGEVEGYLNLLVPLAWACLLALAVEQEPLVGDRRFWITRPYRRRDLLTAKLLFAALFVHLPSFLADCYILKSRGFPPTTYLGELLTKQFVLAGALTLPVMALAALVRSFSHFVLEVVATAVAAVLLLVAFVVPQTEWEVFQTVRWQVILLLGVVAATAVLGLQYFGHRVALSRGIAVAAGLGAALLLCLFLPQSALAIRSSIKPAQAALSIAVGSAPRPMVAGNWGPRHVFSIPIELSGVPAGTHAAVTSLRSRISGPGGTYDQAIHVTRRSFERPPYYFGFTSSPWEEAQPKSMMVNLDSPVADKLKDGTVTIAGEAAVTLYRKRDPVWMGTSETRDFDGLGRCTTHLIERNLSEQALKVECESPRHELNGARVRFWSPESGFERNLYFWQPPSFSRGPNLSWLSPLYRGVAYVDLVPEGSSFKYELRVPRALIPNARIEITRLESLGYAPLHYEFRDLDLGRYVVQQPSRAVAR